MTQRLSWTKWIRLTSIAIGLLIVLLWVFTTFFLEAWMERRIVTAISEATHARYQASIEHVEIDLLSQHFSLTGLHLTRDTIVENESGIALLDQNDLDARLNLDIYGWNIRKLLINNKFDLGSVTLESPQIHYRQFTTQQSQDTTQVKEWTVDKLRAITSGSLQEVLQFEELSISKGQFWFYQPGDTVPYFQVHNFHSGMKSLKTDMPVLDLMKGLEFGFEELEVMTRTGEVIRLGAMQWSDSTVTLDRLSFEPTYSRQEVAERKGHQASWVNLDLHGIKINDVQNQRWVRYLILSVNTVEIDSMWVETYRDKSIPQEDMRHKPLPIQLLQSLPFKLEIDTVNIKHGAALIVQEQEDKPTTGQLSLTHIRAKAYPLRIYGDTAKDIRLEGFLSLYGDVGITIQARFMANTPGYPFALSAWSSGGSLLALNQFIDPEVGLQLESGQCRSMKMDLYANDVQATGTFDFEYSNLVLKPGTNKTGLGLKSLIGNAVIRNDNLKSENNYRQSSITVKREQHKQVFRYVYISLRNGVKKSVGLPTMSPSLEMNLKLPDPKKLFEKKEQN